jgi:hypothetical protein
MKATDPKEMQMTAKTIDRGDFRILVDPAEEQLDQNQYFEVEFVAKATFDEFRIDSEILYVRSARIAYNRAIKAHGRQLTNVTNLETGTLVVGSRF